MIKKAEIDHGNTFDFGRTSTDYAKYRDIYPEEFYQKILDMGLCVRGQRVLDIGTGTGVLPRNLYRYGADFTGIDIAGNQIAEAKSWQSRRICKLIFSVSPQRKRAFPTMRLML